MANAKVKVPNQPAMDGKAKVGAVGNGQAKAPPVKRPVAPPTISGLDLINYKLDLYNQRLDSLEETVRKSEAAQSGLKAVLTKRTEFWGKVAIGVITAIGITFSVLVGVKVDEMSKGADGVKADIRASMSEWNSLTRMILENANETIKRVESHVGKEVDKAEGMIKNFDDEWKRRQKDQEYQASEDKKRRDIMFGDMKAMTVQVEKDVASIRAEAGTQLAALKQTVSEAAVFTEGIKKMGPRFDDNLLSETGEDGNPDLSSLNLLTKAALMNGQKALAVNYLKKALDPNVKGTPTDYYNIGVVAKSWDNPNLAFQIWEAGLKKYPNSRDLKRVVASGFVSQGKITQAESIYKELMESDPTDTETIGYVADLHNKQREYEKALGFLGNKIIDLEKRNVSKDKLSVVYRRLASTHVLMESYQGALTNYAKSAELDPTDDRVFSEWSMALGILAEKEKDLQKQKKYYEDALTQIDTALKVIGGKNDGRKVDDYSIKATILFQLGRKDEAKQALIDGLMLDPTNREVRTALMELFQDEGNTQLAIKIAQGRFQVKDGKILFDVEPTSPRLPAVPPEMKRPEARSAPSPEPSAKAMEKGKGEKKGQD